MKLKKTLAAVATITAIAGFAVTNGATVFAENPDNNSTSLNQDLGSSDTTTTSSTETTASTTQTSEATTQSTTTATDTKTEEEKLPEAGANDVAIASAILALGGGMVLVSLPKFKDQA